MWLDVKFSSLHRHIWRQLASRKNRVMHPAERVLARSKPDVVLHATDSSLEQVTPQIELIVNQGASVISTCEELAWPFIRHPELAARIDQLAKQRGVSVLGTGVNPGADVMGLKRQTVTGEIYPVIAEQDMETDYLTVHRGEVAGVEQVARVMMDGEEKACLRLRMYVGAEDLDHIVIDGVPPIDMTISGGVHGDRATAAIVVNCIPAVLDALPGLRTMVEIPLSYEALSMHATQAQGENENSVSKPL